MFICLSCCTSKQDLCSAGHIKKLFKDLVANFSFVMVNIFMIMCLKKLKCKRLKLYGKSSFRDVYMFMSLDAWDTDIYLRSLNITRHSNSSLRSV